MARNKNIGGLSGRLGMDLGPWKRGVNTAHSDLLRLQQAGQAASAKISASLRTVGSRMQSVGRTMTRSLTLPLAAVGVASVKAFTTFDAKMTESLAIMGDVSAEMRAEMEDAAMSVSEDLNLASSKAAESYFFLASAGLDAKQSVAAMPAVAQFAKAGMFDMATATDLATDAQSALGLTVENSQENLKNLTRVTDVLTRANQLANATVEQFSESLTNRAAAALRSVNKDMEEGVAVLAAFADQGLKGRRAGMFLSRVLRITAQSAAKNTKEFKELGLIDTEGNLASLADIVEILTGELDGLSDTGKAARLEQLGFNARVQDAIKPLLGLSDQIREYETNLRSAQGATKEVANKQLKSLSEQLGRTWQMLRNAAIDIGEMLEPRIRQLNDTVRSAIDAWKGLERGVKERILMIAGLVGVGGPILTGLGIMTKAIGALVGLFASKFGAIALAVGGAAALIISHWDEVSEYFTTGQGAKFVETFKDFTITALKGIARLWDIFGESIVETVKMSFSITADVITAFFEMAGVTLDVFTGRWLTDWDGFLEDVENAFGDTFGEGGFLRTAFMKFIRWFSGGWMQELGGVIADLPIKMLKATGLVSGNFQLVSETIDKMLNPKEAKKQLEDFADFYKGLFSDDILPFVQNVVGKTTEKTFDLWKRKYQEFVSSLPNFQISPTTVNEDSGEKKSGQGFSVASLSSTLDNSASFVKNLENMKAAAGKFSTITQAAFAKTTSAWNNFVQTSKAAGFDFINFMTTQVSGAISGFSETIGETFAGAGAEFASGLQQILLVVADFAKRLGELLIGMGTAIMLVPGLQGPAGGYIAGGSALVALASGAKAFINKSIDRKRQATQEAKQSVTTVDDALVTSTGKIVKFNSQDDILASKDFSKLGLMGKRSRPGSSESINLTGEFRIQGTDLVLTLERTQQMLNR